MQRLSFQIVSTTFTISYAYVVGAEKGSQNGWTNCLVLLSAFFIQQRKLVGVAEVLKQEQDVQLNEWGNKKLGLSCSKWRTFPFLSSSLGISSIDFGIGFSSRRLSRGGPPSPRWPPRPRALPGPPRPFHERRHKFSSERTSTAFL